jgi:hypothetical protein
MFLEERAGDAALQVRLVIEYALAQLITLGES